MKSKADKLDVDKLVLVPVDLSKLSDVVKNNVVKKDVYNANVKNIEDKIPDITNVAINTTFNAKINEVKKETPSFTNLATTTALNAKMMMLKTKYLIETDYEFLKNSMKLKKKITDFDHDKYINTPEFNMLTAENLSARLA